LVNTKERIAEFKRLLVGKELKPRRYKGAYVCSNTSRCRNEIEIVNQNEDVGDYVIIQPGSDDPVIYGNSDAKCYVISRKKKRTLSDRKPVRIPKKAFHRRWYPRKKCFGRL